jgi:molybdenum cofactor cytidylyltransferase
MFMSAENSNIHNTGTILLAAGSSSRLGRPKQLLVYDGQTLLQHSLEAANASGLSPVILVLGADAETIQQHVGGVDAHVVVNANWKEGMASSIRFGIETLMNISSSAEGAVIMMCDQPFVTATLLNNLIDSHNKTGKPVVTCSYADTYGPPTFFHKSIFPELLQLKGDIGARSIVKQHANEVQAVVFPKGDVDVDTEVDYEKLSKSNSEL